MSPLSELGRFMSLSITDGKSLSNSLIEPWSDVFGPIIATLLE